MTHRTRSLVAILGAAAALSGCTSPENDRFRFGEDGMIPAFQSDAAALPTDDQIPSVTGLDRSNWEPVVFVVPVQGTAHQPTYAPGVFDLDSLPRQRGDYPTVETSLDLGEPDSGTEFWFAARTHGMAVVDTVMLLPRLVMRPHEATDWSPVGRYTRVPGQDPVPAAEMPQATERSAGQIDGYDPTDGFFDEADS